jgi:hypothetical protein
MNGSTWLYNSTWSLQYGTTWSQIGGMAPSGGRQSHGAVMLSDGRMVILGGADHLGNAIALSSVLIFDTNTQQYTTMVRYTTFLECTGYSIYLLSFPFQM